MLVEWGSAGVELHIDGRNLFTRAEYIQPGAQIAGDDSDPCAHNRHLADNRHLESVEYAGMDVHLVRNQ